MTQQAATPTTQQTPLEATMNPPINPTHTRDTRLEALDFLPITPAIEAMSVKRAQQKLETAQADYLDKRKRLAPAAQELERLRKTQAAATQHEKEASQSWRKAFLGGFGKQSKEVRELQKKEGQWRIEAEQHAAMIELLEPQVEWLKIQTHMARRTYLKARQAMIEVYTHHTLIDAAQRLFTQDEAQPLLAALPPLFQRVETATCNDALYIASHFHLDVTSQQGRSIRVGLDNEQTSRLNREIKRRQYAAIGELVCRFMPKANATALPEEFKQIAPLACEAKPNELPSSIALRKRLNELEARMEYVPE